MSDHDMLPLADAKLLQREARRTRLVRITLLIVLAAALAYCAWFLLLRPGSAHAGRAERPTVVVLDVSGSIGGQAARLIARLLTSVGSNRKARVGLILFSDSGYAALPPGTRSSELLAYARYFRPPPRAERRPLWFSATYVPAGQTLTYAYMPWRLTFSGGTTISTGLAAARRALLQANIRTADVVVASDFFDNVSDASRLRRELRAYAQIPGITIWTLPLPQASPSGVEQFRRFAKPEPAVYRFSTAVRSGAPAPRAAATAAVPLSASFLFAVCVVLIALAAHEFLGVGFRWGESHP
jgi:hypothetical protein